MENTTDSEGDCEGDVDIGALAGQEAAPIENETDWNVLEIIKNDSLASLLELDCWLP